MVTDSLPSKKILHFYAEQLFALVSLTILGLS